MVGFHFAEMTRDRDLANEHYYNACKCCLSIFTKTKLLFPNIAQFVFSDVALLL